MRRYVMARLASGFLVLIGLSLFSFALIHVIPGDPVRIILGDKAPKEQIGEMRERLGLNKPLVFQYVSYVSGIARGELGNSIKSGRPVLVELTDRFPATAKLAVAGMGIAVVLGIVTGIIAAKWKDTWIDHAIATLASLGLSLPSFWFGLLMIMVFAVHLQWFPVAGGTGLTDLVLPALTLGLLASTMISRLTRSGMIEVLNHDYIRTARAKGMSEPIVLFRHAFRNVMIPIVTIVGLQLATLLGGAIIIEQVFNWPGIGTLAIDAIASRDFPLIQGIIMFMGFVYVTVNSLVDLLYGLLDPRIEQHLEKAGG
ncbi:nickel ABC transporter permease [Brevibacillus fluminis]|uniref:nickel ABC transporter permease n=1 Tax=Brevibacillus fluminis TaxID=511487 RepID=UPI003F89BA74